MTAHFRWHSPKDWRPARTAFGDEGGGGSSSSTAGGGGGTTADDDATSPGAASGGERSAEELAVEAKFGRLSKRMRHEGNVWQTLWAVRARELD